MMLTLGVRECLKEARSFSDLHHKGLLHSISCKISYSEFQKFILFLFFFYFLQKLKSRFNNPQRRELVLA